VRRPFSSRIRWLRPWLLVIAACASPPKPPPERPPPPPPPQRLAPESGSLSEFPDPERAAHLASALPAIETLVRERFAKGSSPGLAFALIIDGKPAMTLTMGDADPELKKPVDRKTRFRIGSLTKTFTAFAIRKLAQDNALELDEPLENLIPEAEKVLYPTADSPKITIAHLLSHQSGLPMNGNYDFSAQSKAPPSEADVVAALDGVVLEAAPGTRTWSGAQRVPAIETT
jgi:CubicO group peptidase (beta-lactamase class C family)